MTAEPGAGIPHAGLEMARQWAATLPADHLQVALQALEPELCREHEWRLKCAQLEHERAVERARLAVQEAQARRAQVLYLAGLGAGLLVSMTMLIGAVVVGSHGQVWLAAVLSGPSVIALTTLFVLRRSDATAVRATAGTQPPPESGP